MNLEIEPGIFGLLGRNGAGKTTLMRVLTTIYKPTSGSVFMNGIEVCEKNKRIIKGKVGYLPQECGFYPNLTVAEFLQYISMLQEMPQKAAKERIDFLLEEFHLAEKRSAKVGTLSGGMKRRLGLAQAMIHEPECLIVDEPTAGLDPDERVRIRNFLAEYGNRKTVLFSTHIIEDVSAVASQIGILQRGKLIYNGSVRQILSEIDGKVYEASLKDEASAAALREGTVILSEIRKGDELQIRFYADRPVPVPDAVCVSATMEDAFLLLEHQKPEGEGLS
ncbi:MAG: ATP-binding cassette domain-containing protein [Clostridia bacterium]|nr:ATP-binding cassette domain-containing protein [Clostridia bacterium]